ncbi:MAG: SpoIID/LytB domain-containing protein [Oscillospiraceae bacterium]|nr:SpoIID/LytB domain-containing protein [Oscillospiraceae bacterium]
MNKFLRTFFLCMLTAVTLTVSARAAEDTLRVGLNYGGSALYSANLQNFQGSGYYLGWFDESTRDFVQAGYLEEEKISMTADGTIYISGGSYYASRPGRVDATAGGYHFQLDEFFPTFEEARRTAERIGDAFPALINNQYRVRAGSFTSREEAEAAAATYATYGYTGAVSSPSATAVTVTVTTTSTILFQFDCSGAKSLGVVPDGGGGKALTWFRGYKWYGGFEYRRSTGGNLNVINVVDVDDYVKGVLPYEMSPAWPLEALKAQAVCARTYALLQTKHRDSYRFDVCTTTDCQVYQGANQASALTDRAVEETAGMAAMYGGKYAETYYYASNGGASESSENVWSMPLPYLVGKEDPYEGTISIPDYVYTMTYSYSQLSALLKSKGYSIGTVSSAYVSRTTPTGNVAEITFRDTAGKTVVITKEACRSVLETKSMRFTISGGGSGGSWQVNPSGGALSSLSGAYTVTASGVSAYEGGDAYVITASGVSRLQKPPAVSGSGSGITISGTGWGHGVGMSQYGAKAMAELGRTYEEILHFYFTGITIGSV